MKYTPNLAQRSPRARVRRVARCRRRLLRWEEEEAGLLEGIYIIFKRYHPSGQRKDPYLQSVLRAGLPCSLLFGMPGW